jgi:Ca2+-dependent lipid-binding protein
MSATGYTQIFDKLSSIDTRLTVIETSVSRLDKSVHGNGKPGLVDDVRDVEVKLDKHLEEFEKNEAKQRTSKDKLDARWWAVIVIFISQVIAWIFQIAKGL